MWWVRSRTIKSSPLHEMSLKLAMYPVSPAGPAALYVKRCKDDIPACSRQCRPQPERTCRIPDAESLETREPAPPWMMTSWMTSWLHYALRRRLAACPPKARGNQGRRMRWILPATARRLVSARPPLSQRNETQLMSHDDHAPDDARVCRSHLCSNPANDSECF